MLNVKHEIEYQDAERFEKSKRYRGVGSSYRAEQEVWTRPSQRGIWREITQDGLKIVLH